jgi:large subunit ribosomal protein L31
MKKDIHPEYYPEARIVCACGNTFTVGATEPEMEVEVCSACHPFYTGIERLVDSEGRVERFERMRKQAEESVTKPDKKERRKVEGTVGEKPKSLKEMLEEARKASSR